MSDPSHRAFRFDAVLPAVLQHAAGELECVADNFSRTGLLLSGRGDWPADDELRLVLRSTGGDLQVPVTVRVARRLPPADDGGPKLAVEFVGIDDETQERLEFLLQRVIEGRAKQQNLPELPPGARPHEIRKLLDAVPLMTRLHVAAHGGPREREPLVHDQNPTVLESLVRNPGLLVTEARNVAGSLFATAPVLTALASDGRFVGDEDLRVLVLSHARVPPGLVERLSEKLSVPALRRVLTKSGLSAAARTAIQKRLVAGERR